MDSGSDSEQQATLNAANPPPACTSESLEIDQQPCSAYSPRTREKSRVERCINDYLTFRCCDVWLSGPDTADWQALLDDEAVSPPDSEATSATAALGSAAALPPSSCGGADLSTLLTSSTSLANLRSLPKDLRDFLLHRCAHQFVSLAPAGGGLCSSRIDRAITAFLARESAADESRRHWFAPSSPTGVVAPAEPPGKGEGKVYSEEKVIKVQCEEPSEGKTSSNGGAPRVPRSGTVYQGSAELDRVTTLLVQTAAGIERGRPHDVGSSQSLLKKAARERRSPSPPKRSVPSPPPSCFKQQHPLSQFSCIGSAPQPRDGNRLPRAPPAATTASAAVTSNGLGGAAIKKFSALSFHAALKQPRTQKAPPPLQRLVPPAPPPVKSTSLPDYSTREGPPTLPLYNRAAPPPPLPLGGVSAGALGVAQRLLHRVGNEPPSLPQYRHVASVPHNTLSRVSPAKGHSLVIPSSLSGIPIAGGNKQQPSTGPQRAQDVGYGRQSSLSKPPHAPLPPQYLRGSVVYVTTKQHHTPPRFSGLYNATSQPLGSPLVSAAQRPSFSPPLPPQRQAKSAFFKHRIPHDCVFVMDTCSLLDLPFGAVSELALYSRVIIPFIVLHEIDGLSKAQQTARAVTARALRDFIADHVHVLQLQKRLEQLDEWLSKPGESNSDDLILGCAIFFKKKLLATTHAPSNLYLVTNDKMLQLKCRGERVSVISTAELLNSVWDG